MELPEPPGLDESSGNCSERSGEPFLSHVGHSMIQTIQMTRSGTALSGSSQDVEKLRKDFNSRHYFRLPSILEPELLQWIHLRVEQASFEPMTHGHIGTELFVRDDPCVGLLHFVANTPTFYEFVESITGRQPIKCFFGRIYRMIPGGGHYDSWHDDLGEPGSPRLLAMSINLSTEVIREEYCKSVSGHRGRLFRR